jgi:multidrug efflux pump subunit AcrB
MNSTNDQIITAKISATVKQVSGEDGITMMEQMRSLAPLLPGNSFAYESTFNDYDSNKVILNEFLSILASCFLSILIVLLIVFTDITATLMVMADVACVVIVVSGSIYWWGM